MILLGSIHRAELDAVLQRHIGRERKSLETIYSDYPDKGVEDEVFENSPQAEVSSLYNA